MTCLGIRDFRGKQHMFYEIDNDLLAEMFSKKIICVGKNNENYR